ncbi:hypothetical protein PENFLA_c064G08524 [Penicillium flavigenum]|uniref:Saccharopine dehydrogenase NADP binding domain-containing protein n=1 Tax=Penicillium flavigenum TaxID=254877 RepID=A0A1V6SFD8_9EURO|nr:hypothetical protein PENFLA_c064G08524 [Penicillium flavigenum]
MFALTSITNTRQWPNRLNFNVTVLSRSFKPFPIGARVKPVDFPSIEDLSTAITGQDAVIDTTFSPEVNTPLRLIDAASTAGVYCLDFGLDPVLLGVHDIPILGRKKVSYNAV